MKKFVAKIIELAKLLVAVNDIEFGRFKRLFDQKMSQVSVDVNSVEKIKAQDLWSEWLQGKEDQMYNSAGSDDEDAKDVVYGFYINWIQPVRSKISQFMSSRTWSIITANEIWNLIESQKNDFMEVMYFGNDGKAVLALEIRDYFENFQKAAQEYMENADALVSDSGFYSELLHIKKIMGELFGEKLYRAVDEVKYAFKRIIEAQNKILKTNSGWMQNIYDNEIKKILNEFAMRSPVGGDDEAWQDYGYMFFMRMVGSQGEQYDVNTWKTLSKSFNSQFARPIIGCLDGIVNDINTFLARHHEDATGFAGRDKNARYVDEADELCEKLIGQYAELARLCKISGIKIDSYIDEAFNELKRSRDTLVVENAAV